MAANDVTALGSDPNQTVEDSVQPEEASPAGAEQSQPSEGEPAETAPEETEGEESEETEGAPDEVYELEAPEGHEVDDAALAAYADVARELNLTQEGAQKILDKVLPAWAEHTAARALEIRAEWAEQAKADKEIGGKKFTESVELARKALSRLGTPELREWLNGSGAGNHPELIRAFAKAGRAISEDTVLTSSTVQKGEEDLDDPAVMQRRMYGESK